MIEINLLTEGHGFLYKNKENRKFKRKEIFFFIFILSCFFIIKLHSFLESKRKNKRNISRNLDFVEVNKENIIKEQNVLFQVIAATCLLEESADFIVNKLKKGLFVSVIKKEVLTFNLPVIWLGNFQGISIVKQIQKKISPLLDLKIQENDGKYNVQTLTLFSSVKAKEILKKIKKKGVNGMIINTKEEREAFVVIAGEFKTFEKAEKFKARLKKNGFESLIKRMKGS